MNRKKLVRWMNEAQLRVLIRRCIRRTHVRLNDRPWTVGLRNRYDYALDRLVVLTGLPRSSHVADITSELVDRVGV